MQMCWSTQSIKSACLPVFTSTLLLCSGFQGTGAEPLKSGSETDRFFTEKIQPLLKENCFKCHSHNADKIKGGFVLDSLGGVLQGGDTGPAIVPGHPEKSLLIKAVRYTDEELQMPPKGKKLSAEQIEALEKWVKLGAPWPGSDPKTATTPGKKITDEDRAFWSFQPLKDPPIPAVQDGGWSRTPIDKFIFKKLQTEGLQPSKAADKRSLIRRAFFDLHGLPPSPEEVEAFVNNASPQAYEQLIDQLLASPRYGERWGRHWLDLVRYAESDGYRIDHPRPDVWRYRDYVIASFNDDKPYDQFVREQLAGDEIDPAEPKNLIATGYLRHWIYEYNNRDVVLQWSTILDDLTDVTGDVFMGLGMSCARCHDHKFDPILQKDYYRLQAFFSPILPRDDLFLASALEQKRYREKLAQWETMTAGLRAELEVLEKPYREKAYKSSYEKFPPETQSLIRKPVGERTSYEHQIAELAYRQVDYEYSRLDATIKGSDKEYLESLRKELVKFEKFKPEPLAKSFAVTDIGPLAPPTKIPKGKNQPEIHPGILTLLDEKPAVIKPISTVLTNSTGRRTELARWITQRDNPLTTRVIANRVWQYHFGRGLVATSSDFGRLGEKPTHPELLDWLSREFVKGGWKFKALHKLIMTSAAYQQSALTPANEIARGKDPENRLLWRMNIRRLDAEQIRDAALAASGELDLKMEGPSVEASKPRRTIYTKVIRNTRDPFLDVFDFPEGFSSTSQRNVTTTPTQSLLMLNGPWTLARAKAMAIRLQKSDLKDDTAVSERAFKILYGREPSQLERDGVIRFLKDQKLRVAENKVAPKGPPFLSEKMAYREGRAAVFNTNSPQDRFQVPGNGMPASGDFTIEAFIVLRSLYEDASVRVIASHWDGNKSNPGWSFGVTSKKSQNKPQTLVLQLSGGGGSENYQAIFSGLHIELNKPYFVAATLRQNDTSEGGVTFYSKDLSNDDEPLQVMPASHRVKLQGDPDSPFTIAGRGTEPSSNWDGLIDDVRFSKAALNPEHLLLTKESVAEHTMGFWQFGEDPFKDSANRGNNIVVKTPESPKVEPAFAALIDFCHVLLNSNEFLYIE